jgi:hypothetical protein
MLAEVRGQTPGPAAHRVCRGGSIWYIVVHCERPPRLALWASAGARPDSEICLKPEPCLMPSPSPSL